jgi:hypothetical protein
MMVFAVRIEHALDVAIYRPKHTDPRKHCWPAQRRNQAQRFHGRLPFWGRVLGLWQLENVIACIP